MHPARDPVHLFEITYKDEEGEQDEELARGRL